MSKIGSKEAQLQALRAAKAKTAKRRPPRQAPQKLARAPTPPVARSPDPTLTARALAFYLEHRKRSKAAMRRHREKKKAAASPATP